MYMKRTIIAAFLAAALTSPAEIIPFELSQGGLSPANEVPPVTTPSTGSGNAISGGISFNTESRQLQVAVGYGSAAGFTDLTGPATGIHIHGPALSTGSASVLFDLAPYHFPAVDPAKGGVVIGTLILPEDKVAVLLDGRMYLNIHTVLNPGGELRGQLEPLVNAAPVVTCGPGATLECGTPTTVTVQVSDPEGDALTVVWTLNGESVQTNKVAAGVSSVPSAVQYTSTLPVGTHQVVASVVDTAENTAACTTQVIIVDSKAPVITDVSANPNALWPPNHKMVPISLRVKATDECETPRWKIISVTSNEPVNGLGDGDTSPDWEIAGDRGLRLRAERSGRGDGRVYTITVRAFDSTGNLSEPKTVTVRVPKSQGRVK
jgi:hypothetical protein